MSLQTDKIQEGEEFIKKLLSEHNGSFDSLMADWRTKSSNACDHTLDGVKADSKIDKQAMSRAPLSLFHSFHTPSSLTIDWATLFTPAAFHLYGANASKVNLMSSYIDTVEHDWYFASHTSNYPILNSFDAPNGDKMWNHVVLALPSQFSAQFFYFLEGVVFGFSDKPADGNITLKIQELEIRDPYRFDGGKFKIYGIGPLFRQPSGKPGKANYTYYGYESKNGEPARPKLYRNQQIREVEFVQVHIKYFDENN